MSEQQDRTFGIMRKGGVILAKVTNITDPDNLNRLKCKPVTADEDVAETDWCYCLSPMAGNGYGQFFFPKVDDLVLLGYLGGDVHHPVVFGSYWANDNKAQYTVTDGKNDIRSIKTPAGIEIKFDDTEGAVNLLISTPAGAVLHIDDGKKTIALQQTPPSGDSGGEGGSEAKAENALTINWEKGEVALAAKTKLTLSAGETTLVLESSGAVTATSKKTIGLDTNDISLAAKNGIKADGAQVDINSKGMMNVKAGGNAVIKGALVQIN